MQAAPPSGPGQGGDGAVLSGGAGKRVSALGDVALKAQTPEGQRWWWWPLVPPCHLQHATCPELAGCRRLLTPRRVVWPSPGLAAAVEPTRGHDLAGS